MSSNARMLRTLVSLGGVALVVVSTGAAHVTLSPAFVEAGVGSTVLFETPNEREGRATTSLRLEAPPGVELGAVAAPAGWELALDDGVATWTGGRIEGTDVVSFPLEVTARTEPGNETFRRGPALRRRRERALGGIADRRPGHGRGCAAQQLGRAVAAGAVGLAVIGDQPRPRVAPAAATTSGEIAEPGATVAPVLFAQILNDDLGCASYLVGCEVAGEVAVVDPHLAIEPILAEAERLDARIVRTIETHTHADHVSGHGRLASITASR